MPDPDDILKDMFMEAETEDRTVYIRDGLQGSRTDFVVIERTSFSGSYPSTVREYHSQSVLPCGHHVDRQHQFGGYCQGLVGIPFRKRRCNKEYCQVCAVRCPRCGMFVSTCCAIPIGGVLHCRRCGNWLRFRQRVKSVLGFLAQPFVSEPTADD